MKNVGRYYKAVVAFVAPGAVVIGSAVADASTGGAKITTAEWVTALVACVVTSAGVAAVANMTVLFLIPRWVRAASSLRPSG
jgi:hypothetical protein